MGVYYFLGNRSLCSSSCDMLQENTKYPWILDALNPIACVIDIYSRVVKRFLMFPLQAVHIWPPE